MYNIFTGKTLFTINEDFPGTEWTGPRHTPGHTPAPSTPRPKLQWYEEVPSWWLHEPADYSAFAKKLAGKGITNHQEVRDILDLNTRIKNNIAGLKRNAAMVDQLKAEKASANDPRVKVARSRMEYYNAELEKNKTLASSVGIDTTSFTPATTTSPAAAPTSPAATPAAAIPTPKGPVSDLLPTLAIGAAVGGTWYLIKKANERKRRREHQER
jgi:hypothetical protein